MLRVLSRPRWIGALVLALVFAALCIRLGQWQWHRYEFKVDRAERIAANYDAAPAGLADLLPREAGALPQPQEWRRVTLTGRYVDDQMLVRNRPHRGRDARGTYGYEVLVPFQITAPAVDKGRLIVVDRGWVPNAETAAQLPDVPAFPQGEVEVTGWLRPGERSYGRELPEGQVASINVSDVAAALDPDVALEPAYVILQSESRGGVPLPEADRPAALDRPDTGLGSHQAYAFQWWGASVFGLVLVLWAARREAAEVRPGRGAVTPSSALGAAVGSPPPREDGDDALARELARGRRGRPDRARRTRARRQWIWDEEDE